MLIIQTAKNPNNNTDPMNFIDFATKTFLDDAKEPEIKEKMLECFKAENDDQLIERITSVMENLTIKYVMETGKTLIINDVKETAILVLARLKQKLASELADK